ncbi:hypothetical protein C8Q74DRAFT_1373338 [Fomes fomentarius]|nr:hypothetical protein C8Q74DRAFT_1373338 [Fomes fomentarius]
MSSPPFGHTNGLLGPSSSVYNVGAGVRKGFLDVTERDIQTIVDTNIHGAFAFSHQLITAFKKNELDTKGKRGTLIFTGATASVRGNVTTSIFSAGKSALRALSQSEQGVREGEYSCCSCA